MNNVLIEEIKGVGKITKQAFNKHKIRSVLDLLLSYPVNYQYYHLKQISKDNHNKNISVLAKISSEINIKHFKNISAASFKVTTNNILINVLAFRKEYLSKSLNVNDEIIINGKLDFYKKEIIASKVISKQAYMEVKPIYKINNILDTNVTKIIKEIYKNEVYIKENIPKQQLINNKLISRNDAIKKLHLPKDSKDLDVAIRRMKYEEAYFFQKSLINNVNKQVKRTPIKYDLVKVQALINTLPYNLTKDQKAAVNDIFKDYKKSRVAYRLIQGDVGSGKTVVAAIGLYGAITAGLQVVLMAPTELLAKQHYTYFKMLFRDHVRISLLTSQTKNKKEIKTDLSKGKIDLLIGTHAVIEEDVVFKNLGLIIVDEQHKFGVRSRATLSNKAINADLIYLTATPIPRTLAISLFSEADITLIKEKPKDRIKVKTEYILDDKKDYIYKVIKETLNRNEKIYIVVPAIESKHAKYNVGNVYQEISNHFAKEMIYTLHGKISNLDKSKIMENFINSKKAILIATTMIEVGIDVKDATLIIIYSANYFGLSQLHQLRGRVGRANLASKCILVSQSDDVERLSLLTKINDGFELSKYDLKLRGPGALIGLDQTGIPNFNHLSFIDDYNILKKARLDLETKG